MPDITDLIAAQVDFLQDLKDATDNLVDLNNRTYGYTHDEIVTTDLEADYQAIISKVSALEDVSAVGMLAILKEGNVITPQGNRLFINGEEVVNPAGYTFSGENSQNGIEIVKIWYFQNGNNQLTLQENFDYIIISANVRQIETMNINASYLNYINMITIDGGFVPVSDSSIKTVIDNYGVGGHLPKLVETCYSTRNVVGGTQNEQSTFANLNNGYKMKTIYLPELTQILKTSFWESASIENIYCPNLKSIIGDTIGTYYTPIRRCPNLIFTVPVGCETLYGICFSDSIKGIVLECKDAQFSDNWGGAIGNIQIFEMCSDWGASINIVRPAGLSNWTNQKYIDLMNNKLRNMTLTNETRTLTIPNAKLTILQEDEEGSVALATATEKGWTISGA